MKDLKAMLIIGLSAVTLMAIFIGFHYGVVYDPKSMDMFTGLRLGMAHLKSNPFAIFPFNQYSLMATGVIAGLGYTVTFIIAFGIHKRQYDEDAAGSAKWNEDFKTFSAYYSAPIDTENHRNYKNDGYENAIVTQRIRQSLNDKESGRNSNCLVIGGSGAGKTFFYALPNGLQMNACFVFTDPKGELLEDLGGVLKKYGYDLKIFNLQNMNRSMCYNPFHYIRDIKGVNSTVRSIVENTAGESKGGGSEGPFWDNSMKVLMQACVHYLRETRPEKDQNFANVMKMLRLAEVDEKNANAKSKFDKLFDELAQVNPDSQALKSYRAFRIASGNTLKSILVTVTTRLQAFDIPQIKLLTSKDTIHLEEIGRKKTALFIVLPDEDPTFNFLAATLYTQLFERLYYDAKNFFPYASMWGNGRDYYLYSTNEEVLKERVKACKQAKVIYNKKNERYEIINKKFNDGEVIESFAMETAAKWWLSHVNDDDNKIVQGERSLPYYVRMILDEFYNIGTIPNFPNKMSTVRSYKISVSIIVQNLSQITDMFGKEKMETIVGQCDSTLFLGANDRTTLEHVVYTLGKTSKTQKSLSLSNQLGKDSESRQKVTADLLPYDQAQQLDNKECIFIMRGEKPFRDKKYSAVNHPHFKECGKMNKKNKYVCEFIVDKNYDENDESAKNKQIDIAKAKKNRICVLDFNIKEIVEEIFNGEKTEIKQEQAVDNKPPEIEGETEETIDTGKLINDSGGEKRNHKRDKTERLNKAKAKRKKHEDKYIEDDMVIDDTYDKPSKPMTREERSENISNRVEVLAIDEPVITNPTEEEVENELLAREEETKDEMIGFVDHYSMMDSVSWY